jgi:hypothetical protein
MAVPVKFAIELLRRVGWKSPEELQKEAETANANKQPSPANTP